MGVNFWALHGNGDAIEEDDDEDHVVKHLVGDDPMTQEAKSAPRQRQSLRGEVLPADPTPAGSSQPAGPSQPKTTLPPDPSITPP